MRMELQTFSPGEAWVILPMTENPISNGRYVIIDLSTHEVLAKTPKRNLTLGEIEAMETLIAARHKQDHEPLKLFLPDEISALAVFMQVASVKNIACFRPSLQEFALLHQQVYRGISELSLTHEEIAL